MLGVCVLVAYQGLIGYDPAADVRGALRGAEGAMFSPVATSPFLVFGALFWMLWLRSQRIRASLGDSRFLWLAPPLLSAAAFLLVWSRYTGAVHLQIPSLSLAFLGAGAWLGGRRGLSVMLVPALFLLLLLPLPSALLNAVLFPLQMLTVDLTRDSLTLLGIESVVEGDRIQTQRGVFQVIETCSGLRMIFTMAMSSILYAEIFRLPRGRALTLLFLSFSLSIFINNLRVLSIVFNPYSRFAAVHTMQGLVMIVLGVFALAALDQLLSRILPDGPPRRLPRRVLPPPVPRVALLAGFFAVSSILAWATPVWTPPPMSGAWTLSNLPLQFGPWDSESLKVDQEFLGSVNFSERSFRRFQTDDRWVDVFIGVDDHLKPSISLLSEKTRYPGSGWNLIEDSEPIRVDGVEVRSFVGESRGQRVLVYHWTEGVGSTFEEALRGFFALDRSRFRRAERAMVARLVTPLTGGREAAEARLSPFVGFVSHGIDSLDKVASVAVAGDGGGEVEH